MNPPRRNRIALFKDDARYFFQRVKEYPWKLKIRTHLLTILTVLGVLSGIGLGFILRAIPGITWKNKYNSRNVTYVKFLGDLFLSMIKCMVLPLIVSSLIVGVGSLDLRLSRKIGGRGIAYYLCTSFQSVIIGTILSVSIKPGKLAKKKMDVEDQETQPTTVQDTLMDLVRNMFPPNIIQATFQQFQTELTEINNTKIVNGTITRNNTITIDEYPMADSWNAATNILGIIVFCIALGIALSGMGHRAKPLLQVFQSLSEATTMMTTWIIWLSPVGVTFLLAAEVIGIDDFGSKMAALGAYLGVVTLGLTIHCFMILPTFYFLFTRKNPFRFVANMLPAIMMAFSSSSSNATLPVTMKCLEGANKVDVRVSRFLLPIGATINMDGGGLYYAAAVFFIAQLEGIDLSVGKIITISITAACTSVGAAGIPQSGLVAIVLILNTVGMESKFLKHIVPLDWLLDRMTTVVNVMGDCYGAAVIDHMCREELAKMPPIRVQSSRLVVAEDHRQSVESSSDHVQFQPQSIESQSVESQPIEQGSSVESSQASK